MTDLGACPRVGLRVTTGEGAMGWMFMPLRRYADFSGRSRRMEFWMWQVFQILLYVILVLLAVVMGGSAIAMTSRTSPSNSTLIDLKSTCFSWIFTISP